MTKKSCYILFWSLDLQNAMMPLMTPSVCYDANASASHYQKGHFVSHFCHLDLWNTKVPLMMSLVSPDATQMTMQWCDANTDLIIESHDQKSQVTPHFNHLDLRNLLVPFVMLSVSMWCQRHCFTKKSNAILHFNQFNLRNTITHFLMLLASDNVNANTNASHDQIGHAAPHFNSTEPRNSMLPFIMLMPMVSHDQKVMLHLVSIILA